MSYRGISGLKNKVEFLLRGGGCDLGLVEPGGVAVCVVVLVGGIGDRVGTGA